MTATCPQRTEITISHEIPCKDKLVCHSNRISAWVAAINRPNPLATDVFYDRTTLGSDFRDHRREPKLGHLIWYHLSDSESSNKSLLSQDQAHQRSFINIFFLLRTGFHVQGPSAPLWYYQLYICARRKATVKWRKFGNPAHKTRLSQKHWKQIFSVNKPLKFAMFPNQELRGVFILWSYHVLSSFIMHDGVTLFMYGEEML